MFEIKCLINNPQECRLAAEFFNRVADIREKNDAEMRAAIAASKYADAPDPTTLDSSIVPLPLDGAHPAQQKKRGRPRKDNTPAAGAPQGDSADSQPAVERNTGTDQAEQSPEAVVGVAKGGVPGNEAQAPAAAPMDDAAFKQAMLALTPKDGDINAFHTRVFAALSAFGYAKVKDVKPEHYDAVLAKVKEAK